MHPLCAETRSLVRRSAVLALSGTVLFAGCWPQVIGRSSGVETAVSADGARVAFTESVSGSTTLVLIHGWSCNRAYWDAQVSHFSASHRVVALDLVGHGSSDATRSDWTISRFADDVVSVVRASGAKRVVLIGHSLGGPIAVEAALRLPDEVAAVIGIDTFFDAWTGASFADVVSRMRSDFAGTTRQFVRAAMFTARSDTAVVRRVADSMADAAPAVGVPTLASLIPWATERADSAFSALRVPLGVLQASASGHGQLQRSSTRLPRYEVVVMPGAGHFPMLEDPAQFNALLDSLLRRISE
jgi:pimeloyl-ACP methyl ester carboxylesterase